MIGVIKVESQPDLGARTVRTGQDSFVGAGPIERIPAVVICREAVLEARPRILYIRGCTAEW